tara:strand:- start:922 stop:1674 length:753 start_codon:yes stop_codon:yes gene_type:complete
MDIKNKFAVGITKDYKMFNFLDTNRKPNSKMIDKLTESIKQYGIQIPIIVNPDKYIVDGQHRFWALRSLNYSVPYIVSQTWKEDKHTIEINNTGKRWTALDYANYSAQTGNLDVHEALLIAEQWEAETGRKLRATTSLEILMESKKYQILTSLKNNTYKLGREKAEEVFNILNCMADFKMKASPFSARIARSIKSMVYDFNGLNEDIIKIMCQDNYIQNFNKENDQLEYLVDLYKEAKNKYNKKNKKDGE